MPRQQLYLIDGYALIYRAFFAMIGRPLTTSRGENTSAAWGVTNFLIRLLQEYRPRYVAWVHDAGTSFRKETYPDYKATREKLDNELQEEFDQSVSRIEQLLAAFNVRLVTVDGYEADDVIGTLAERASQQGVDVVIVSGDKDFYQLISRSVTLLNPGRGGPAAVEERRVNLSNAQERLGVPPERVVDYLALVGDASDNIPGVRGVGDKTARKLIADYGDLDSILEHAAEVKGKRAREGLIADAGNARLSRELVTIRRDVPVSFDLDDLSVNDPDNGMLAGLFSELEFHALLRELEGREQEVEADYGLVQSVAEVGEIVRLLKEADMVAVDTQASSLEASFDELVGLSVAGGHGRSWYFPLAHRPQGELAADGAPQNLPPLTDPSMRHLVDLLEDPGVAKAGHDIKHDRLRLRRARVELQGVEYDSKLASFLIDPGRRSQSLDILALEYSGVRLKSYSDVVGSGKSERSFGEISVKDAAGFSAARSAAVLKLRERFAPKLDELALGRLLEEIEVPLISVLVDMEWRGIAVDRERLKTLSEEFGEELRGLESSIYTEAGTDFNINSTPQLRHILFEKLGLPVIKKTKTGASTDADVLAQLAGLGFMLPGLLLEFRELSKLKSTYVDALPNYVNPTTGRIHTSFNQTGAATGRLSSSDPNLQNIPVRTARGGLIRQCFVAPAGCRFIAADYSQIELRVLAHLSEDEAFIGAFKKGGDIHRETAAAIFGVAPEDVTSDMRGRAKTINFATIYGQGPYALSRQLSISVSEAKEFIRVYFERFAGVRSFLDRTIERARQLGYVETLFGRRRYIPELKDSNHNVRAFGERTAMNSPMQGSAADLIKAAMINLAAALDREGLEAAMVLQVHDELLLEAPEGEVEVACEIVRREMEGAAKLEVPVVVDVGVGSNWLDAKA